MQEVVCRNVRYEYGVTGEDCEVLPGAVGWD